MQVLKKAVFFIPLYPHPTVGFPRSSMIKNPPEMQEMWVTSLGQEDPLKKEKGTHSSIFLARKSHGQRSLVGYSPWGCKVSDSLSTRTRPSL